MSHMIPTLSPERYAADHTWHGYGTSPADYQPKHVAKHKRDVYAPPFSDPASLARCTGSEMRGGSDGAGRLLIRCKSVVCPHHHADAYADCMARHAVDSLMPARPLPARSHTHGYVGAATPMLGQSRDTYL